MTTERELRPLPPAGYGTSVELLMEYFLGEQINADDHAGMLGMLGRPPFTEPQIVSALQEQLKRLSSHPQSMTPQGDQVRFAMHVAVAKLLSQVASDVPEAGAIPAHVRDQVQRVVASAGGINRDVMQQLKVIAAQHNLDVVTLAQSLTARDQSGVGPAPQPKFAPTPRKSTMEPEPAEQAKDPGQAFVIAVGWAVGGLLTLLIVAAVVIVLIARSPARGKATPAAQATAVQTPIAVTTQRSGRDGAGAANTPERTPVAPKLTPAPTPVNHVEEWPDIVRRMNGVALEVRTKNTSALADFSKAYGEMAMMWTQAPPDQRTSGVNSVLEVIFAASPSAATAGDLQMSLELLGAISARSAAGAGPPRADEVVPAVWTAGVISRLSRERELNRTVVRQIDAIYAEIFGAGGGGDSSFESGAGASLIALASRSVPPAPQMLDQQVAENTERWRRWLEACRSGSPSPVFYTQTVLRALDLLVRGPSPARDESVFNAMTSLVCAVTWRQDDPTRRWLLERFDSASCSGDALSVLTRALATQSGAPGVDATMVLGMQASDAARAQLREQYASVWAVSAGPAREAVFEKWLAAANAELDHNDPRDDPFIKGVQAVSLARLCEAAWLLSSTLTPATTPGPNAPPAAVPPANASASAQADVELMLLDPDSGLSKRLTALANGSNRPGLVNTTTEWARQYAEAAQRVPDRLKLMSSLSATPTFVEARLVIEDACRSSSEKVLSAAQNAVKRSASSPAMVAAMLEALPFVPQTNQNTELLRSLTASTQIPNSRDASWRVAARRALVERLLEMLSGDSPVAMADQIGTAMADSYRRMLSASSDSGHTNDGPQIVAGRLIAQITPQAQRIIPTGREPLSISAIVSNKAARERMASGQIQEFAARQATLLELLAYMTAADRPLEAERTAQILSECALERQRATHVLVQVYAQQRAMLQLWVLKLAPTPGRTAGGGT
jgi:hypothetical protein